MWRSRSSTEAQTTALLPSKPKIFETRRNRGIGGTRQSGNRGARKAAGLPQRQVLKFSIRVLSAQIRGIFFLLRCLLSSVFQRCSYRVRGDHCRGGVFLTVITTSHAPFAMNSKAAGKKYLL